ncbi:MAG: hypothetical protein ACK5N8_08225 [Alphaproteobacteria bacterium]
MNAKEAVELINNNGGDISKIPSSQLFDVLSALHGNFEFSGDYRKVFDYLDTNKDVAQAISTEQDKLLYGASLNNLGYFHAQSPSDVINFEVSSLEELDFKRDVTKLFGTDEAVEKLDNEIAVLFETYSVKEYQPSLSEIQVIRELSLKIESGSLPTGFLKEMQALEDQYLLAEGSGKWASLTESEVQENIDAITKVYEENEFEYPKFFERIEIDNIPFLDKAENLDGSNEWLPSEKYKKELSGFIDDEVMRKLAMNPDFNGLDDDKKFEAITAKREEVAQDYVRKLLINQYAHDFSSKLISGSSISKEDMDKIVGEASKTMDDFIGGYGIEKFKVKKDIALATLNEGIKDSVAVSKEIFKRTGIKSFYEKASARRDKFAKDHPVIYKAGKSLGIAAGIGVVTCVAPPIGTVLSTVYAAHKTHVAYKALKTKYVNDPHYKNKSFKEYMLDHKAESAALFMTGVMAAFPTIGFARTVGVVEPDKAALGIARGSAVLALGISNATSMYFKAKTKKEKVMALAVAGASIAGASLAVFTSSEYGQEVMKNVSEKLGAFFGGSKVAGDVVQAKTDSFAKVDSIPSVKSDTIPTSRMDSIPVARQDSIGGLRPDSIPALKSDSIPTSRMDSIPVAKADSTEIMPSKSGAGNNTQVVEHSVSARADVGQGDISNKDWSRIKIRSTQTYGVDKVKEWSFNINSGQVEAIPDGMSKEEFIYKLGQLQKLAPVVHKESINLMLRDLNCDGTVLTSEQIAQVHESLKTIDIKGEYHGYEPTERTCNRVTGIKVDVNCDDKTVNVKQTVEYGDCNKQETPVVHEEPVVQQKTPIEEPKQVVERTPHYDEPAVVEEYEQPVQTRTPVVETPVVEAVEKEIKIKGTVTNTEGVLGDGKDTTALDKMAAKGVVGDEYHGDEAPEVANEARLANDEVAINMYKNKEVVPFMPNEKMAQGAEYNQLKADAIQNKELVQMPLDKKTGKIITTGVDENHEDFVDFVKKGSPLHNYLTEQASKTKLTPVQQAKIISQSRY